MTLLLSESDAAPREVELTLDGATFGYTREKALIRRVSLEIRAGDFISICGENGAGKSTLVKGMLGLLAPLEGRRVVNPGLEKAGIGYVAQTSNLPPDMPGSVIEVLKTGLLQTWRPWSISRAQRGLLGNVLSHFDCDTLAAKAFRELSGGQMKRVLIARAVLASRRFIVLDEPCAGLDTLNTDRIMTSLKELNTTMGTTIVQVTHDAVLARRLSSRIWHVGEGTVRDEVQEVRQ